MGYIFNLNTNTCNTKRTVHYNNKNLKLNNVSVHTNILHNYI